MLCMFLLSYMFSVKIPLIKIAKQSDIPKFLLGSTDK